MPIEPTNELVVDAPAPSFEGRDGSCGEQSPRVDALELWYQPKIDLQRKCLGGAQVELRCCDGEVGRIQGAGGAGEDGLTEQVLLLALAQWETFQQAGFPLRLAIKLPLRALLSPLLAPLLDECRPRSEQWPGIILEISEGEVVGDLKPVQEIAEHLRVSAVDLAISDFGAGYSSLANLRGLGFVELKLDRSFVAGCAADAINAAICQTAVDLAHRFGSAAVAQGIDRGDDLRALMVMGCNLGQGPLLGPSMPQREFLALLRQRAR